MLRDFINNQKRWSLKTFGPGRRTKGTCEHIRRELQEIERTPGDVTEWVDVIILGIEGAWRTGHCALEIVQALVRKQQENFTRTWPAHVSEDEPAEHVREDQCA